MADAVQIDTRIQLGPLNSFTAPPINVGGSFAQILGTAGTVSCLVSQVTAGTPEALTFDWTDHIPRYMALFLDDTVNPQTIKWSFVTQSGGAEQLFNWLGQISTTCPVAITGIGVTLQGPGAHITLTNMGTGTTTVRCYFWGT